MLNSKYKVLKVTLDGKPTLVPTINNSYIYTVWVLRHKYKVKMFDTYQLTYLEKQTYNIKFGKSTWDYNTSMKEIEVVTPKPYPAVDLQNHASILLLLGADAVLLLGSTTDSIVDIITKDISITSYTPISTFFDNYITTLQIKSKKIHGKSPTLNGIKFYNYTNRKRKNFNRWAEILRKLLNTETNRERKHAKIHEEVTLTATMREYYETQLHEFVYTYIYKGKTSYGKQ